MKKIQNEKLNLQSELSLPLNL